MLPKSVNLFIDEMLVHSVKSSDSAVNKSVFYRKLCIRRIQNIKMGGKFCGFRMCFPY